MLERLDFRSEFNLCVNLNSNFLSVESECCLINVTKNCAFYSLLFTFTLLIVLGLL